ncbi:MAG TPA: histidine kinase dimerization/phospho-acceptor domain-containing protein [Gemmatimonadaceae bacterium]|nr:histidine kinase dimerization/phospho-acceptor domain-containing protein [Gemmatimonadaceae bacterium]
MAAETAARLLWLEALQRLADGAAHEIKNPLNGLAVNLEVVRSRAERGGADVATVARFATAAAEELQRTAALVEALLAVSRPARAPVDLWMVLQPLVALYGAIAAASGGTLVLERPAESMGATEADPAAVRLAMTSALAGVAYDEATVRCSLETRDGAVMMSVRGAPATAPAGDVRAVIERAGIGVELLSDGLRLRFAPAGGGARTTV